MDAYPGRTAARFSGRRALKSALAATAAFALAFAELAMSLLTPRSRARRKALVAFLLPLAFLGALVTAAPASAATDSLTITPTEWNVVGLDSNNVLAGPNQYPVGAQVCNITGVAVTNRVLLAWANVTATAGG